MSHGFSALLHQGGKYSVHRGFSSFFSPPAFSALRQQLATFLSSGSLQAHDSSEAVLRSCGFLPRPAQALSLNLHIMVKPSYAAQSFFQGRFPWSKRQRVHPVVTVVVLSAVKAASKHQLYHAQTFILESKEPQQHKKATRSSGLMFVFGEFQPLFVLSGRSASCRRADAGAAWPQFLAL